MTSEAVALEAGILDEVEHERLLRDLDKWVKKAGIPKSHVFRPMSETCSDKEVRWVGELYSHSDCGKAGVIYMGRFNPPVEDRFAAIAAALLRCYKDARVMTRHDVIQQGKDEGVDLCRVLLIPDFFNVGAKVQDWQVSVLRSVLMERKLNDLQTVVYIEDMKEMEMAYGSGFKDFISGCYKKYKQQ